MHAVAVARPRPRLPVGGQLGLELPAEGLAAVQVRGYLLGSITVMKHTALNTLHLREELPALVSLVRGAGGVAALGGGPGAAAEAAAEPVLGVVTLVIVGELPEQCLH